METGRVKVVHEINTDMQVGGGMNGSRATVFAVDDDELLTIEGDPKYMRIVFETFLEVLDLMTEEATPGKETPCDTQTK